MNDSTDLMNDSTGPMNNSTGPMNNSTGSTNDSTGPMNDSTGPANDSTGPANDSTGPASGGTSPMHGRKGLTVTTLVTAAASAVVLFAATRHWDAIMTHQVSPLPPTTEYRTGADMSPWLPALGAVGLAGAGALLATRGRLRTIVGGLLALAGIGIVGAVIGTLRHHIDVGWPILTIAAAVLVAAAGAVTVRYSGTWPEMGARYERPSGGTETKAPQTQLWDALDRGEDPTADK